MTPKPAWLLPNLLSLDAPLVAVCWQALLAADTGLALRPAAQVALGLTVWLIYIVDRLLDVRDPHAVQTARHRFYRDHRTLAAVAAIAILIVDLAVIVLFVRPVVVREGLLAAAGVLAYLILLHGPGWRIPKELLAGILFTAGVFVVAIANSAAPVAELGARAAAFFLLCLSNLILIELWESQELPRAATKASPRITVALCRAFPAWTVALAAGASVAAYTGRSTWFLAIAISAAALYGLFRVGVRWTLEARRVLVDAVLLTPVVFLL